MPTIINPHKVSLNDVRIIGGGKITIGNKCQIRNFTVIELGNGELVLNDYSVIGYHSFLQVTGKIVIGKDTLLGPHCSYISSTHEIKPNVPISKIPLVRGFITIGTHVWVGANCTINHNVKIGDNSIIGANAFVNKEVPPNQVWAGVPAKYLKDNK
jgi:maltose O-acetyltransferase